MAMSDIAASFQDVDYADVSSWPTVLKLIGSLLVGVGMLVAMYMLLYQPKLDLLKVVEDQELGLRAEFVEKQKLAANLPAYQQQMIEIKERFDKVLRQLPEASEVPALLVNISEAGIEQGLVFQRFKPSKGEQREFYVRLPIQIKASGTYHQLGGFISAIANFQRVVTVGNLDIVRAGRGNANNDGLTPLTFTSTIYTYHFSKDKGVGGDEVLRIQQ
jgi:type IV pilus assembly protein PilO